MLFHDFIRFQYLDSISYHVLAQVAIHIQMDFLVDQPGPGAARLLAGFGAAPRDASHRSALPQKSAALRLQIKAFLPLNFRFNAATSPR
jgi:hypothetical protein